MDDKRRGTGSGRIYLFDDEASVKEFLAGPLAAGLTGQPAFSHISVKQFDVIEDPTAITRGPVREGCPGLGYNRPAGGQTVKIIK